MNTALLVIDPQNDFCHPEGTLYVAGAADDCERLASFITTQSMCINSIHVTLDIHPYYHIAHPPFWKDKTGKNPDPFTIITYEDFSKGLFMPIDETISERVEQYLQNLEAKGRYNLTLWPLHCLRGSNGISVEKNIWDAIHAWEVVHPRMNVNYVAKAANPYTEHYSGIQSEVPDPEDATTGINFAFINELKKANHIIIAGEALSHCVANTVRDISTYIPLNQITLLTDCTSAIKGYEAEAQTFLEEMTARGMKIAKSTEITLTTS